MSRRPVGKAQLLREARIAWADDKKRRAVQSGRKRAAQERAEPSEALRGWASKDPARWEARDVLGCYASKYLAVMGSEDVSITKTTMGRLSGTARTLLEKLRVEEIDPETYINWAVTYCRQPGTYPKDGIPSMTVLVYEWILLKAYKARSAPRPSRGQPRNGANRRGGTSWVAGS